MKIKAVEFLKLTQGTRSVTEYMPVFNSLARYAKSHVDTEEKKIDCFKRGLSTKLQKILGSFQVCYVQ